MSASFARRARRALRLLASEPGALRGIAVHADGCLAPLLDCNCDPVVIIMQATPGNNAWIENAKISRRESIEMSLS